MDGGRARLERRTNALLTQDGVLRVGGGFAWSAPGCAWIGNGLLLPGRGFAIPILTAGDGDGFSALLTLERMALSSGVGMVGRMRECVVLR